MRARSIVGLSVVFTCGSASHPGLVERDSATSRDPSIAAVLDAFRDHQVVGVGEVHYSAAEHRWLRQLISEPAFARAVNDIVVEFGNSR